MNGAFDIIGVGIVGQSTPDPRELAEIFGAIDLEGIAAATLIVVAAYLTNRVLGGLLERLAEDAAERRLVTKRAATFVRLGIFLLAFYLVVATLFEGRQKLLIGLGGTIAVAAGLALEDTVSSLFAGILILVDRPFQVGDRITFGDTYGEVTRIGLLSVRIDTLDDDEVAVPNNRFLSDSVSSASAGTLDMMVVAAFDVAITEDTQLAKRLVFETCVSSRYVYLDEPVTMHVREVETDAGLAARIICRAYILDARYETDYVSDLTDRVKQAFRSHDIQRPYHREYLLRSAERADVADGEPYVRTGARERPSGSEEDAEP